MANQRPRSADIREMLVIDLTRSRMGGNLSEREGGPDADRIHLVLRLLLAHIKD